MNCEYCGRGWTELVLVWDCYHCPDCCDCEDEQDDS